MIANFWMEAWIEEQASEFASLAQSLSLRWSLRALLNEIPGQVVITISSDLHQSFWIQFTNMTYTQTNQILKPKAQILFDQPVVFLKDSTWIEPGKTFTLDQIPEKRLLWKLHFLRFYEKSLHAWWTCNIFCPNLENCNFYEISYSRIW